MLDEPYRVLRTPRTLTNVYIFKKERMGIFARFIGSGQCRIEIFCKVGKDRKMVGRFFSAESFTGIVDYNLSQYLLPKSKLVIKCKARTKRAVIRELELYTSSFEEL